MTTDLPRLARLVRYDVELLARHIQHVETGNQTDRGNVFDVLEAELKFALGVVPDNLDLDARALSGGVTRAASVLRDAVSGPVVLTWRTPPAFSLGQKSLVLACRLKFEPLQ